MKKRAFIIAMCMTLALSFGAVAGCSSSDDGAASNPDAVAGTETTPRLMPAQHQKYIDRPAYKCYKCHGASEKGNPTVSTSRAMPAGHYVDNDPSSFQLDPNREECRTCHSVDPNKQMNADVLEDAEVETGQQDLDEQ
jgi:cytochrome c-type protein NapB